MKKNKVGLWATIIAAGLLTTACVGNVREEKAIFKRDYSIGHLSVYSRDIVLDNDEYRIKIKGPEEKDEFTMVVSQKWLKDFTFIDKEGQLYKIGMSNYNKNNSIRNEKLLFKKETEMGDLTVSDIDVAWGSDFYKVELKGDNGSLEIIAQQDAPKLNIRFSGKDGTVYRLNR